MPKVSVVMSTYNEQISHLNLAIDSILCQTYEAFEFIIVVDNPTNKIIIENLNQYRDSDERISILINEKNIGLAKSLNRGIENANGDYIVRMDADDISAPDRIEKQVLFMKKNPHIDIACCQRKDIDMQGNEIGKGSYYINKAEGIAQILHYGSPITHPGLIVKTDVYKKLNGYRNFAAAQDYDFYLRALKSGFTIGMMEDVLLKYRINTNGISKSGKLKQFLYKEYALLLFENEKLIFSDENCHQFLDKHGYFNPIVREKFDVGIEKLTKYISCKNVFGVLLEFLKDKNVRKYFVRSVKYKQILNKYV